MMRNQSIAGQCEGKHPYDTWAKANAARAKSRKAKCKAGRDRPVFEIYRCDICGAWHLAGKGHG